MFRAGAWGCESTLNVCFALTRFETGVWNALAAFARCCRRSRSACLVGERSSRVDARVRLDHRTTALSWNTCGVAQNASSEITWPSRERTQPTTNAASSRLCSLGFKGFRGRSSFAKARAERPEERQVDEFERVATYEGLGRAVLNSAERAQRTRRIEAHRGRACLLYTSPSPRD